jgi:chromate transporter
MLRSHKVMKKSLMDWVLFNLKIGTLSFGGSGRILFYQERVVKHHKWLTEEDVRELVTLGQTVPGPNLVNMAHFMGQRVFGFWGSFFGLLFLIVPGSFLTLFLIEILPLENIYMRILLQGFTLGSVYVFLLMVYSYAKGVFSGWNQRNLLKTLVVIGVVAMVFLGIPFFKVLLLGGLTGFLIEFFVKDKH